VKIWYAPFAAVSLMAAIGWSTDEVTPKVNPPIRRERSDAGDSSLGSQIQTSASGWLWAYTEVYLANGIKMRRMTQKEAAENGFNDGRDHGTTVIPPPAKDFRGIFGDVDRSVNAWNAVQRFKQNDPRQCLPLFRLMTWLDPNFVEAWTNGAMVIAMDRTEKANQMAMEFLREGYKRNPDCVDIPTTFGMLEITRHRDFDKSIGFFQKAVENGQRRFDALSENEKQAFLSAYRWLTLAYRNTGRLKQMNQAIREGLTYFPDDQVMPGTGRPSIVPPASYQPPIGVTTRAL